MLSYVTLILFSVAAIGIMILLVRLTALSHPLSIKRNEQVLAAIYEHYPDANVEDVVISADGKSALASQKNDEKIIIIGVLGDRIIVRQLETGSLDQVVKGPGTLNLILRDFTWPNVQVDFTDPPSLSLWQSKITSCLELEETGHA